jgi:hypothetical protein
MSLRQWLAALLVGFACGYAAMWLVDGIARLFTDDAGTGWVAVLELFMLTFTAGAVYKAMKDRFARQAPPLEPPLAEMLDTSETTDS